MIYGKKVLVFFIIFSLIIQSITPLQLVYADSDFIYRLNKTVAGDKISVKSGEGFTYNITYSINGEVNGNRIVNGFRIEEELPKNVEYVGNVKDGNVKEVKIEKDLKTGIQKVIFIFKDDMETGSAGLLTVTVRFKKGCAVIDEKTEGGSTKIFANNIITNLSELKVEEPSPVVTAEVHDEYRVKALFTMKTPNPILSERVDYQIEIQGEPLGGRNLTNATLECYIPEEAGEVIGINAGGIYDEFTRTVTWKNQTIGVGASLKYYVSCIYDKASIVSLSAKVTGIPYGAYDSYEVLSNELKHTFSQVERGNPTLTKSNAMEKSGQIREYSEGQIAIFKLDNFFNSSNGRIDKMELIDSLPTSLKVKKVKFDLEAMPSIMDIKIYDDNDFLIQQFETKPNTKSRHEVVFDELNDINKIRIVFGEDTGNIAPYLKPGIVYVYTEVLSNEKDTLDNTLGKEYKNEAIFHTYKDEWIEKEIVVNDVLVDNTENLETNNDEKNSDEINGNISIIPEDIKMNDDVLSSSVDNLVIESKDVEIDENISVEHKDTENVVENQNVNENISSSVDNVENNVLDDKITDDNNLKTEIINDSLDLENKVINNAENTEIKDNITDNLNENLDITENNLDKKSEIVEDNLDENSNEIVEEKKTELVKETIIVSSPISFAKFLVSDKKSYPSINIIADKSSVDYNDNIRMHMVLRNDNYATSDIYSVDSDSWKLVVEMDNTVFDTSNINFTSVNGGSVVSKQGTMFVSNIDKITDGKIDYFIITLNGSIAPYKNDPFEPKDTDFEIYWNTKIKDNSVRCGNYSISGFLLPGGTYDVNWMSHNRKIVKDIYGENIPNIGINENTDLIYVKSNLFNKFIGNIKATKLVKGELDNDYGVTAETISGSKVNTNTLQGGRVDYKIHVSNEGGNGAIKNIVVVDKLPNIDNDTGIYTGPRNSKWNPILIGNMSIVAENVEKTGVLEAYYSTKTNPDLTILSNPLSTPNSDWSKEVDNIYDVKYIMFKLNGYEVGPAQYVDIEFPMVAQAGAPVNQETFNSVAVVATYQDISNGKVIDRPFTAVEAGKVSHKIVEENDPTKFGIGNRIFFDANNNGIFDNDEFGINGIKVALYKKENGKYKFIRYTYSADGLVDGKQIPGFYMFPASLTEDDYEILMLVPKEFNLEAAKCNIGNDEKLDSDFKKLSPEKMIEYSLLQTEIEKYDFYSYNEAHGKDLHLYKNEKDTISFGLYRNVNLKAKVFYDDSMTGIYSEKNISQKGVNIGLYKYDKVNDKVLEKIGEKLTNADGEAIFEDLEPIDYIFEMIPNIKDYKISPLSNTDKGNKFSKQNIGTVENPEYHIYSEPIITKSEYLPDGKNVEYETYGYVHQGRIAGYVFNDNNGNGIKDKDDLGISNVDVVLYKKIDIGEKIEVQTTKTDINGHYTFEHLVVGDYKVVFNSSKVPTKRHNYSDNIQNSVINRNKIDLDKYETDWIFVDRGDIFESCSAGFYDLKTVTLKIFNDKNHNNQYDLSENIQSIDLDKLKASLIIPIGTNPKLDDKEQNNVISNEIEEISNVEFKDGHYIVKFENIHPTDKEYKLSLNCNDENYSFVKKQGKINFYENELFYIESAKPNKEFLGAIKQAKITGVLFDDLENNGYQNSDPVLKKITDKPIKLFMTENKLDNFYHQEYENSVYKTEISDKEFNFENVLKSNYYIYIMIPSVLQYKPSDFQNLNYKGLDGNYDVFEYSVDGKAIEVLAGNSYNYNFGFYQEANISAYFFNDFNKNGLEDNNDNHVFENFEVELWNNENTDKIVDLVKFSDLFNIKIKPGNYNLHFIKPDFYTNFTKQNEVGTNPSNTNEQEEKINILPISLKSGDDILYRSGVYRNVPIKVNVFCEMGDNPKGIKDDTDIWFEDGGIEFKVFKIEDNGSKIPVLLGDDYKIISNQGTHTVLIPSNNFETGKYRVEAILPNGYKLSPKGNDNNKISNVFDIDKANKICNFEVNGLEDEIIFNMGIYKTASVSLKVYFDKNGNTIKDEDENLVLDNWNVNLLKDGIIWSNGLLKNGLCVFDNLPVGSYELKIDLPEGYVYSNQTIKKINIYSTDFNKDYIIGVYKNDATLNINFFHDEDEFIQQGKAIKPIIDIALNRINNDGEKSLVVEENLSIWKDNILFNELYPSNYQFDLRLKPHYKISKKTAENFGTNFESVFSDGNSVSDLIGIQSKEVKDVFVGIYRTVTVKGKIVTSNNLPVTDTEVILKDLDGNIINITKSDNLGNYEFSSLRHGKYFIEINGKVVNENGVNYKYASLKTMFETSDIDDDGIDEINYVLDKYIVKFTATPYSIVANGKTTSDFLFEVYKSNGDLVEDAIVVFDATKDSNGNELNDLEKGIFDSQLPNNIDCNIFDENHKIEKNIKNGNAIVTFTSPNMEGTMKFLKIPIKAKVDLGKGAYLEDEVELEFTPDYIVGTIKDYKGNLINNANITVIKEFIYLKNNKDENTVEINENGNSYEYISNKDGAIFVYNGYSDENGCYKIYIPYGSFQQLKDENEEISGTFTPVKYELDIVIPEKTSEIGEEIAFRQNAITKSNQNGVEKEQLSEKTIVGVVKVQSPNNDNNLTQQGIIVEYTHEDGTKIRYTVDNKGLIVRDKPNILSEKTISFRNISDDENEDSIIKSGKYTRRVFIQVKNLLGEIEELEIGNEQIILLEDGDFVLDQILIDPYGTITDEKTKEPIENVKVTLYDYDNNIIVKLPLDNRAMSNNENPQNSNEYGKYAWYVPKGKYYIIAEKSGYEKYDSRIDKGLKDGEFFEGDFIEVIDKIVRWDFEMKKIPYIFYPTENIELDNVLKGKEHELSKENLNSNEKELSKEDSSKNKKDKLSKEDSNKNKKDKLSKENSSKNKKDKLSKENLSKNKKDKLSKENSSKNKKDKLSKEDLNKNNKSKDNDEDKNINKDNDDDYNINIVKTYDLIPLTLLKFGFIISLLYIIYFIYRKNKNK